MLADWRSSQTSHDVVILGAGPAGTLSAITCARHGLRVLVIDSRLGRPSRRPQTDHAHVITTDTWDSLRGLASVEPERDRWRLDAALETLCQRHQNITLTPYASGPLTHGPMQGPRQGQGGWSSALQARVVVDCSGTSRASLRSLPAQCEAGLLEAPGRSTHASLRLAGVTWPDGTDSHLAQRRHGAGGAIAHRVSTTETLMTLQGGPAEVLPHQADMFLAALEALDDVCLNRLCHGALPIGSVHRWTNRRMSRVQVSNPALAPGWLAIGDALLTTPPRLGLGLAQICSQVNILQRGLEQDDSPPEVLSELLIDSRERFYAAALAQELWEQAVANDPQVRDTARSAAS